MGVVATKLWAWAASAARGAFRDAAFLGLGLVILVTPVVVVHGDSSARLLARAAGIGEAAGALGLARLAVVGGHALMVFSLVLLAGLVSLGARLCWPGCIWCCKRLGRAMPPRFTAIWTAPPGQVPEQSRDSGLARIALCAAVFGVAAVLSSVGSAHNAGLFLLFPSLATVCAIIVLTLAARAAKRPRKG